MAYLVRGLAAAKHGEEHGLEPPAAAEAALRAAGHLANRNKTTTVPKRGGWREEIACNHPWSNKPVATQDGPQSHQ